MAWFPAEGGGNVAKGTMPLSSSSTTRVELGFEPKYIAVCSYASGSPIAAGSLCYVYDSDEDASGYMRVYRYNGQNLINYLSVTDRGSDAYMFIDSTGFGFGPSNSFGNYGALHYFALG